MSITITVTVHGASAKVDIHNTIADDAYDQEAPENIPPWDRPTPTDEEKPDGRDETP